MPADTQARWAATLMHGFASAGVKHLVLSPGSRSTPFVLAALESTLQIHDVIDERAAAFFALGLARATGLPPLLLCTSGTAAGHYLPAVMEASASHVPLLVLTADRPFELHGSGANQTIDQQRLFGVHARSFVELGAADEGSLRGVLRHVAQATLTTQWPAPGPVQINARARKPLEGTAAPLDAAITRVDAPRVSASPEAVARLRDALAASERPLVVAGPAPASQRDANARVHQLCAKLDAPLVADITSQLEGDLCGSVVSLLDPDLVLQIGRAPIAASVERFLAGRPRIVLTRHGWPDPSSDAEAIVLGEVVDTLDALLGGPFERDRADWRVEADGARAEAGKRRTLALQEFGPLAVARTVVGSAPADGFFCVGNSLVARLVDRVGVHPSARVLHQRGVSGIDGLVAGAAGAAASGHPTLLFLGDVSLLHDIGGLACPGETPRVVVVLNDDGGRIFERLPIHGTLDDAQFEAHFATRHGRDFSHAAALYGHAYARAEDEAGLRAAIAAGFARSGCTLVEVRVRAARGREEERILGGEAR